MRNRLKACAPPIRWILFALMMIGLPLLGIIAAGRDPSPYLEFPPLTPTGIGIFSITVGMDRNTLYVYVDFLVFCSLIYEFYD